MYKCCTHKCEVMCHSSVCTKISHITTPSTIQCMHMTQCTNILYIITPTQIQRMQQARKLPVVIINNNTGLF
jgi:hypothetical protein